MNRPLYVLSFGKASMKPRKSNSKIFSRNFWSLNPLEATAFFYEWKGRRSSVWISIHERENQRKRKRKHLLRIRSKKQNLWKIDQSPTLESRIRYFYSHWFRREMFLQEKIWGICGLADEIAISLHFFFYLLSSACSLFSFSETFKGATCYLNSLLQVLYHLSEFRKVSIKIFFFHSTFSLPHNWLLS